jgi:hypothetical protein
MLIRMAATMMAATMTKKRPQPLMPCAVFFIGCPHLGHAAALEETSEPQAGQFVNAIFLLSQYT